MRSRPCAWNRSYAAPWQRPRAQRHRHERRPQGRHAGLDAVRRQPRRHRWRDGGRGLSRCRTRAAIAPTRPLVGVAVRAGGGVGAATRRHDGQAKPNPRASSSDVAARFDRDRRTGAAANAFGVNTAAAAAGPPVARINARSGRPEALMPAVVPPARNPAGRAARRSTAGACGVINAVTAIYGASGSCSSPAVSGRPWTILNDWTAWPAAPLTRLSSTPIAMIRPVRSSSRTWTST